MRIRGPSRYLAYSSIGGLVVRGRRLPRTFWNWEPPRLVDAAAPHPRLQLTCGDALEAGGHSSGDADGRQAAIGSDTEAADGTIPAVTRVEEAAVYAQGHVGRRASSAR